MVSHNELTGGIPSKICNLSSLVVLDLSNKNMSGEISPCIGNLTSHNLSVVDLHMNKFLGVIPSTFTKDSILRNLDLNGNKLEGPLPLLNCRKLEVLDLGNNKINDTFAKWLESLPMLQVLILRSNKFHGPIINQKTRFPFRMLRIMDLSHNRFSGLLPRKYFENLMGMIHVRDNGLKCMDHGYYLDTVMVVIKGSYFQLEKILVMFTTIDFSNNIFVGDIPTVIGKLKSLKGLNFSHNQLTGYIPRSFGNLTNLDISTNRLVGEIPRELADLAMLAKLNLSENRLVGSIPNGKQFDTFENDSYNGNLGLCGLPLSRTCTNAVVYPLPSSSFQREDDLEDVNGFHSKVVRMGYWIGMVIGISTGYIVLSTGKLDCAVKVIGRELRSKMVKKPKQSLHVHKVRSRNE